MQSKIIGILDTTVVLRLQMVGQHGEVIVIPYNAAIVDEFRGVRVWGCKGVGARYFSSITVKLVSWGLPIISVHLIPI
ncbi:hypothetical protein DSM107007_07900 [Nostoc sp. PCC 7120 = FACHB-418]|nr:hypothetical protein DSM107007_07900 [Nostoc sp. PCC 7120 = FACHB-418]